MGSAMPMNDHPPCDRCSAKAHCVAAGVEAAHSESFDHARSPARLIRAGEHLVRAGQRFESLYVIQSGAFKSYIVTEDGEEQVVGFHLAGDTLGFEAIADGRFNVNCIALETASVCRLPFDAVSKLSAESAKVRQELLSEMSREISRLEGLLLRGRKSAEQRVAAFLLGQSQHQARRGCYPNTFTLPMSRTDIGNYSGLALETVSRVLGRFQDQGLLTRERKHIWLHDIDALQRIAQEPGEGMSVPASEARVSAASRH